MALSNVLKELLIKSNINIRISFPNGELTDIINTNISEEKFSFIETIDDGELNFGNLSIPYIQFQTSDIPNLKGKEIDVYIEVYCDSSIQGSVYKSDLLTYVYPIKIGHFVITKSSLNGNSDIFKVRNNVAYASIINDYLSLREDYLAYLNSSWFTDKTGVRLYIEDINDTYYYDESLINEALNYSEVSNNVPLGSYTMNISGNAYKIKTNIVGGGSKGNTTFYRVFNYYKFNGDWKGYIDRINAFYDSILSYLDELGVSYDDSLMYNLIPMEKLTIPTSYTKNTNNYSGSQTTNYSIQGDFDTDTKKVKVKDSYKPLDKSVGVTVHLNQNYYSTLSNTKDVYYEWGTKGEIIIPRDLTVTINGRTFTFDGSSYISSINTLQKTKVDILEQSNSLYKIDIPRSIKTSVSRRRTAKFNGSTGAFIEWTSTNVKRKEYTADTSEVMGASVKDIMQAYAELNGLMPYINRNGLFELKSLVTEPVDTITMSEWTQCNWSEYGIKTIGRIILNYNDVNEEGDISTLSIDLYDDFNDGYLTYIVNDNWILSQSAITQVQAQSILETMANNIKGISYLPFELIGIGRPDLKAGDFINVETSEGTFTTCIMSRILKGVQHLTDNFEAEENEGNSSGTTGSGSVNNSTVSGRSNTAYANTKDYFVSDVTYMSDTQFSVTISEINGSDVKTNIYNKTEEGGVITLTNQTNGHATTFKGWS